MIRRTIPALCAALLLAGCAQTGAGVAARVGDTAVGTDRLSGVVSRGYANKQFANSVPQADYQRVWLGKLIDRVVADEAMRRLGVTVTDEQVEAKVKEFADEANGREQLEQAAAAQGIAKEDLRDAVEDLVIREAISDKLVADVTVTDAQLRAQYAKSLPQLDIARIAHIAVAKKATADKVAADARKGGDFAALAKKHSLDTETAATGGELGEVGNGSGKFEQVFMKAIFGAEKGEVVGPIKAQSGFEIVKILDRRTTSFAAARDRLRREVLDQERTKRFEEYVTKLKAELGVSVNPRFGRWNAQTGVVEPTGGNGLSATEPTPAPPQNGVLPGGQPGGQPPGGQQPGGQPPAGSAQPGTQPGQPGTQPGTGTQPPQ